MNNRISNISFQAKPVREIPKKIREIKSEMPDFFRDSELFDSEKDMVTNGYFRYNKEDVMPSKPYFTDRLPYQSVVDTYAENIMNGRSYLNKKPNEPTIEYDY